MYHHKISLNHFPMAICNKLPGGIPSGKHTKNYGKSAFLMGKSTISMAIFHSYVCLPGGIHWPHGILPLRRVSTCLSKNYHPGNM